MGVKEIGDPRLQALFGASDPRGGGVRPRVRLPGRGLPPAVIVMGAVLLAVLLFSVLNARRMGSAEPPVSSQSTSRQTVWQAPPPLYIPPVPVPVATPSPTIASPPAQLTVMPAPARIIQRTPAPIIYAPPLTPQMLSAPIPAARRASSGSPLVIDTGGTSGSAGLPAAGMSPLGPATQVITRMRASALASRSTTVPQGYLIPAVLETGFDSTQPGFARAVVSRDVRGFDGRNILVPRGSRLIGEYKSSVAQGQNRAVIIWTRLIRPDGMTIAMDSPAVDTVGRGGVPATVNTHFFARLGDALLQTTIGLGGALAQRSVTGPVVVLPGSAASATGQIAAGNTYVPTLTVSAGKSISVFVAHDLDFSAAGSAR